MTRPLALVALLALPLSLAACRQDQTATLDTAPPPPRPADDDPFGTGDAGFQDDATAAPPVDDDPPVEEVTFTRTPPAQPSPPAGGRTHTIRKGDTLWSLAVQYYGNGQRWVDIANANPGVNPKKLYVGNDLVIP